MMDGIQRVIELRQTWLVAKARLEHKTTLLGEASPLLEAYRKDVTLAEDTLNEAVLENRHRLRLVIGGKQAA